MATNRPQAATGRPQTTSGVGRARFQEWPRGGRKKRQAAVELNLGQVVAALQRQRRARKEDAPRPRPRPLVIAVSGSAPLLPKAAPCGPAPPAPHNPLDSSGPLLKKGKQRLVPKPKKPTPLKKIILKEREERRQQRLLEQAGAPPNPGPPKAPAPEDPGDPGDPADRPEAPAPAPAIHSRRFREYCQQLVPRELDACVWALLRALRGFQERGFLERGLPRERERERDPHPRPRPKRRLVLGLREVRKHLRLRRLAAVLLSPDCEAVRATGGLDELLGEVVGAAGQQGVPLVFALSRRALGRCLNKPVPVSGVGVFSYDGAQDHFHRMLELSEAARRGYQQLVAAGATLAPATPDPPGPRPPPDPADDPAEATAEPRYIQVWRQELSEYRPSDPESDPDSNLDPPLTLAGLDLGGETPAPLV
ncbi:selenocysteine insertion sequence-binding protein 2-like [Tachyglossus aculeatus]|uniref:selenocysteine insertion sequence-binding protein 2-like n=1 Tax=Tachyglossus aculeatus TaxID=9261 RepID=UPI0018F42CDA|nr:selenocysteine insertion sequence-binding protein 2-like [Tachyglossus aculeatus]